MPTMEQLYERAVEIATAAHEGQSRWGGEPYITHPLAVAKSFGMGRAKVVAVLHDVIEDTNITEEDLRKEFPYTMIGNLLLMLCSPSHTGRVKHMLTILCACATTTFLA